MCSAGWRAQDSLEIFIACQTRLKVEFVTIVYLDWTPEDSSRGTSDQQDPCLETRKIHIFNYSLSPVGRGEEVKCMVRWQVFLSRVRLGWRMRHSGGDLFKPWGPKVGGGPRRLQPSGNNVGHSTFKMRPKTELLHILNMRMRVARERGIGKLRCQRGQ